MLARQLRGATERVLSHNPWLSASMLALALLCAGDLLIPLHISTPAFIGYLTALGLLVALVHGALWSLAFRVVASIRRPWAVLLWPIGMLGLGLMLAHELGAFARLQSRYRELAVFVLASCSLGGIAFGCVCALFQPSLKRPAGFILERSALWRGPLALLLLATCVGLSYADRQLFPNQYQPAHTALRLAALATLTMACVAALRFLPRIRLWHWPLALIAFATAACLLDAKQTTTLSLFNAVPWPDGILKLSRSLLDWDGDGYASLLGSSDCAPWNSSIYPGAREIPDNGIDENCVMGDAKRKPARYEALPIPSKPAPFDVVLVTIDAFSPSHLGLYDPVRYGPNGRGTTPNLDRWAQQATVFERAYSSGGWTSIAVPSLFRGVYARRLQWVRYYETNLSALLRKPLETQLRAGEGPLHLFPLSFADPHPTLAEMLRRRGMYCIAVTDDGYGSMLQRGTGVERGFDVFRQVDELPPEQRNDAGTADLALHVLNSAPRDRRMFAWVHFFGTHWPDEHHDGVRTYGQSNTPLDAFDHEVAYLDTQVIRVLDALAQRPTPTAVIVASDHGEGLTLVTRTHGLTLDEEVIRIPMLARIPGWPARRISQVVGSIDLVPTILALTETPGPRYLDGMDLAPFVHGAPNKTRTLITDTWRLALDDKVEIDLSAVFDGSRKYILDNLTGELHFVRQHRETDPAQPADKSQLVGVGPRDPLSSAVYTYVEETGEMLLSD